MNYSSAEHPIGRPINIPLRSSDYLFDLPFHSPTQASPGGHWGNKDAVNYLACGNSFPAALDVTPSIGWFTEAESMCSPYTPSSPDPHDTRHYFMPDQPVSSVFSPRLDVMFESNALVSTKDHNTSGVLDDIVLHGSFHETAYIWADVMIRSRSSAGPVNRQSLIVDTGSSLTTFPCKTRCLEGLCPSHEHHIDPPQSIDHIHGYAVPCSPSCRSCLVSKSAIRRNLAGGVSAAGNYCRNVLNEFTSEAHQSPKNSISTSRKITQGNLYPNGSRIASFRNSYRQPSDFVNSPWVQSSVIEDIFKSRSRNNMLNHYFWSLMPGRSTQQAVDMTSFDMVQRRPLVTPFSLESGNSILKNNLDKLYNSYYSSGVQSLSQSEVNLRSRMFDNELNQWLSRTTDINFGSVDDYLFMQKSNLWRWQKDIGLSFVNLVDMKKLPICLIEDPHGGPLLRVDRDTNTLIIETEQPPLLADSICAFEVAYMEGSKLRGSFRVGDIEVGVKEVGETTIQGDDDKKMHFPIVHGCTSLETHLFLDQLATGIMGLEPWPYYPVETTMASVTRRSSSFEKSHGIGSAFHLCFSGQGGLMRLHYPFTELGDRSLRANDPLRLLTGATTLLEAMLKHDRLEAVKDPYFTSSPPQRGRFAIPEGYSEVGSHERERQNEGHQGPEALTMFVVSEVTRSRPSYTLGLFRLHFEIDGNYEMNILPYNKPDFEGIVKLPETLPESMEVNTIYKKMKIRGMPSLNEKLKTARSKMNNLISSVINNEDLLKDEFLSSPILVDSGTTMTHFPVALYQVVLDGIDGIVRRSINTHQSSGARRLSVQHQESPLPVFVSPDPLIDLTTVADEDIWRATSNVPVSEWSSQDSKMAEGVSYVVPRSVIKDWDEIHTFGEANYALMHDEVPQPSAARRYRSEKVTTDRSEPARGDHPLNLGDRNLQTSPEVSSDVVLHRNEGQACWFLPTGRANLDYFPVLTFEFVGGVIKRWFPEQYTYAKSEKWRCMTISSTTTDLMQLGMSFFIDEDIGFHTRRQEGAVEEFSSYLYPPYRNSASWLATLRRATVHGRSGMGSGPEAVVGISMNPSICPRVGLRQKQVESEAT
eukprot:GHVH01006698.1.p1 GENE.GHVH01006698.1~~GHVH01006698.1.p1  ORF type:complete len:1096 (+),score=137.29 GHVH01006698.1:113-3400(+)